MCIWEDSERIRVEKNKWVVGVEKKGNYGGNFSRGHFPTFVNVSGVSVYKAI